MAPDQGERQREESQVAQVAIVTGGSRGIGRAVAEGLLDAGWTVRFCSRSPESVERAGRELGERFGTRVAGEAVDVRSQEQVDAFVAGVAERDGRLDCLVNNAGIGRFGPVDEISGEQWREVVETNLSGAFYFLRAAARAMKPRGRGHIFNVASLAGKHAMAGGAAYNASKFGLVGLSEAAMLDLRQHGIKVAALLPGSVATDFGSGRGGDSDWRIAPEDLAHLVLHLLSYPDRTLPSLVEVRPTRPGR
jgi:3-oxoacyl-[acyl-carrier protein] reductase